MVATELKHNFDPRVDEARLEIRVASLFYSVTRRSELFQNIPFLVSIQIVGVPLTCDRLIKTPLKNLVTTNGVLIHETQKKHRK